MTENNDKKKWGRRLGVFIGVATLVSVAFYVCVFRGPDYLEYFKQYSMIIFGIGAVVTTGLTATDVWGKFGK